MPSPETSRENLQKAKAAARPPRPWHSQSESRLIRIFEWHWYLGRGPWCSGRALARWLGVSHTYIQKLTRTLSRDERDFLREVAHFGLPSIEGLRRAREESQQQRERGLLRVVRDFVPTEPNLATMLANNPFLPDAPTPATHSQGKLDYNAIHMWNLRMNAEREKAMRPWRPARRI